MSDYYDTSYHYQWEPLAEFHFYLKDDEEPDDDEYFHCLCSRVLIRDKVYHAEKDASESDLDIMRGSKNDEFEDQSHVHFSSDTSYKVKCDKDENASCYCSASHTDNYCSTDEHDLAQPHGTTSHILQTSDSGADLTYQDCHDYSQYKFEKMEQDLPSTTETNENYFSENTWDKFWGINGERLIWASWIKKYSNYINPSYLDENNDLLLDDSRTPMEVAKENVNKDFDFNNKVEENIRERKFSYDSKVNPYRKVYGHNQGDKCEKANQMVSGQDDTFTPINRRRSCSEHDRMLSPRTLATSDSMTNVTKLTMSSYDVNSSHVTSDSSPTDDYSVSTSTSDDQNDQTRIANVEENFDFIPSDEVDSEQYWQFLWKKHFGEQYALHYERYVRCHSSQSTVVPSINVETYSDTVNETVQEIEFENSEGNSQEMPTVMEKTEPEKQKADKTKTEVRKPQKRRNNKSNFKYIDSVGVLLQNLLLEEQKKVESNEAVDAGEETNSKKEKIEKTESTDQVDASVSLTSTTIKQSENLYQNCDDGDNDPPEERPFTLKRSHELDEEESAEKIKNTFQIMGFSVTPNNMPRGTLVYKRRNAILRGPKNKKLAKKIYFDYDGNPYQAEESQDEREILTDDDCLDSTNDDIEKNDNINELENEGMDKTFNSSVTEEKDAELSGNAEDSDEVEEVVAEKKGRGNYSRKKRPKFTATLEELAKMPPELNGDPTMYKYWMKRFSLFSRYDEGCRLDLESWFSITPEKVAEHIAHKLSNYPVVLDAFCGAGGNTIQFAMVCEKVIAVDIDPLKIELAKHNAAIYGVLDKIEFVVGDFFKLAQNLKADFVFLSPPWGGPNYTNNTHYDLESMLEPKPASELMRVAFSISTNVSMYLPRNTKTDQLLAISMTHGGSIEIEQNFLDKRFVAISAYYALA